MIVGVLIGTLLLVIVLGCGVELTCRAWNARRGYFVYRPNERRTITPVPDLSPFLPNRTVTIRANSVGERGTEPSSQLDQSLRLLFAGGSAGECYFLDQNETIASRTQEFLLERGPWAHVFVGSVCRSGFNIRSILRVLEATQGRYHATDVVVFLIGASEVINWVRLGAHSSSYEVAPDGQIFEVYPGVRFEWTWTRSALREAIKALWLSVFRMTTVHQAAGRRQQRLSHSIWSTASVPLSSIGDFDMLLRHLAVATEDLVTFARKLANRIVVIPQPAFENCTTAQAQGAFWQGAIEQGSLKGHRVDHDELFCALRRARDVVEDAARRSGAEVITLTPDSFKPSADFMYDELHLTGLGAREIAKIIAERIVSTS